MRRETGTRIQLDGYPAIMTTIREQQQRHISERRRTFRVKDGDIWKSDSFIHPEYPAVGTEKRSDVFLDDFRNDGRPPPKKKKKERKKQTNKQRSSTRCVQSIVGF